MSGPPATADCHALQVRLLCGMSGSSGDAQPLRRPTAARARRRQKRLPIPSTRQAMSDLRPSTAAVVTKTAVACRLRSGSFVSASTRRCVRADLSGRPQREPQKQRESYRDHSLVRLLSPAEHRVSSLVPRDSAKKEERENSEDDDRRAKHEEIDPRGPRNGGARYANQRTRAQAKTKHDRRKVFTQHSRKAANTRSRSRRP